MWDQKRCDLFSSISFTRIFPVLTDSWDSYFSRLTFFLAYTLCRKFFLLWIFLLNWSFYYSLLIPRTGHFLYCIYHFFSVLQPRYVFPVDILLQSLFWKGPCETFTSLGKLNGWILIKFSNAILINRCHIYKLRKTFCIWMWGFWQQKDTIFCYHI